MKNSRRWLLAPCLAVLFLVLFVSSVRSAPGETTIKVTPSILEKMVKPGDVYSGQTKVANNSVQEITLYAYLKDFKAAAEDESGRAELIVPGTETGNYISSWINISTEGIVLGPGEERAVPYTINIPSNVGPGGYYGAIVFGTQAPKLKPGEADTGAAIGIAQQAASLVLLQVEGIADERADIREFKTDKQFYSTPFDVKFTTKISNLGNVHVKPRGVIEIKDMLGKNVTTLAVNEDGGNILPKSSRTFLNNWKDRFGFGKYEASLALSYGTPADQGGEGRKTLTMFWYFWVLPAKIIISVISSLLVLVVLFFVFLRHYRKAAISKAMEQMGVKGGTMPLKKKKIWTRENEYVLTFSILAGIALAVLAILYFLLF